MTTIVSSESVKTKFEEELSKQLSIDHWLVRKTPPVTKNQILNISRQNNTQDGCVIIFVKYGKRTPSQFSEICVGSIVVSLIFYRNFEDIANWINALQCYPERKYRKEQVLAMMKPLYLKWGEKIYQSLREVRHKKDSIDKHLADTTTKSELSHLLSEGCSLAIYVGHGRSRGWSGYRGVRWKDIEQFEQKKPIGNMISLSCSSLKNDKEFSLPFGLQWVMEGRCCTFIGACATVKIKPLAVITEIILKCMSDSEINRVNELIISINNHIIALNDADVSVNWSKFRLIGNPYQSLRK
jgi:hypothetical protein